MRCKWCKRKIYSSINDKCYNCFYSWEGLDLTDKIFIIIEILILILAFSLLLHK